MKRSYLFSQRTKQPLSGTSERKYLPFLFPLSVHVSTDVPFPVDSVQISFQSRDDRINRQPNRYIVIHELKIPPPCNNGSTILLLIPLLLLISSIRLIDRRKIDGWSTVAPFSDRSFIRNLFGSGAARGASTGIRILLGIPRSLPFPRYVYPRRVTGRVN